MTAPEKIVERLKAEPCWRVLCHVKPDGDTLGSASALVSAGKKLGKKVEWGGPDPVPGGYHFLPWIEEYRQYSSLPRDGCCVVALDISTPERTAEGAPVQICIDHHLDNAGFGELNWISPQFSSVGEMVFALIQELGCSWDVPMAEALYVSISTDTGDFKFSNTSADTLRIASELLQIGVSTVKIDELLHFNDSLEKLHLWGLCLSRAKQINGRAVLSWISRQDFRETGATEGDSEALVNMLTHVAGTQVAVLVSEFSDQLRCSIRSRGECSAQLFASKWGGGGHKYAAGCKIPLPLQEGLALLEKELQRV